MAPVRAHGVTAPSRTRCSPNEGPTAARRPKPVQPPPCCVPFVHELVHEFVHVLS